MLLHSTQLWVLFIGSLAPLVSYVLNYFGPHVSEKVKAVVHVVVAAAAGALFTALDTSHFGFNAFTAQEVLTAVVAALSAHHLLWKPSTIAAALGAGDNHQADPVPVAPAPAPVPPAG